MTDDTQDFRPEARAPKGFEDRRARQIAAERRIIAAVTPVYERYGFEPLDTGAFEYAALRQRPAARDDDEHEHHREAGQARHGSDCRPITGTRPD